MGNDEGFLLHLSDWDGVIMIGEAIEKDRRVTGELVPIGTDMEVADVPIEETRVKVIVQLKEVCC